MIELINLQKRCLELYNRYLECSQNCTLNQYCVNKACNIGDCTRCLYDIHHNNADFHYSCTKITYLYTLRFFNRFASEIVHMLVRFRYDNIKDLNVVSLGCGPGSEIYGIIKTLLLKKASTILHYEGHDLNLYWNHVQEISIQCLSKFHHEISFYNTDLFTDFHGFANGTIHLLMLNYLLSDAVFFMTEKMKFQFIDNIATFIVEKNVKCVFFNDINFYGEPNKLNSGTQMMKLLINVLGSKGIGLKILYYCFKKDPYRGTEGWIKHNDDMNLLLKLPDNIYMNNVDFCNSKQIIIIIK